MKRLVLIALALLLVLATPLAAQNFDLGGFSDSFETLSAEVAGDLTFNSTLGLNWSDGHIGNFPHFGVGVTVGATTVPFEAVNAVLQDTVRISLPAEIDTLAQQFGMPIPGLMAEARLGGFGIPFDIGVKYGEFLPEFEALVNLQNIGLTLDYLVAGADVRFRLVEESGLVPLISVGGGVNYMEGGIGLTGLLGSPQQIEIDLSPFPNVLLEMDDPSFNFTWSAFTIDLKAQVSKNLWIVTPYAGFGASLGSTTVGGGLSAPNFTIDGNEANPAEIEQLLQDLEDANFEVPEETFSAEGFNLQAVTDGWSFRAYGGLSLNLFFIRTDITAMYDIASGALGGSVNLRFQI